MGYNVVKIKHYQQVVGCLESFNGRGEVDPLGGICPSAAMEGNRPPPLPLFQRTRPRVKESSKTGIECMGYNNRHIVRRWFALEANLIVLGLHESIMPLIQGDRIRISSQPAKYCITGCRYLSFSGIGRI